MGVVWEWCDTLVICGVMRSIRHMATQSAAVKRQYALDLLSSKEVAVTRRRQELQVEAEEERTTQLLARALALDVDLEVCLSFSLSLSLSLPFSLSVSRSFSRLFLLSRSSSVCAVRLWLCSCLAFVHGVGVCKWWRGV